MYKIFYPLLAAAFVLCVTSVTAQTSALYFPPKTGTNWQTLSPESQGFCPERIDSLYTFLQIQNTKSFLLLKDGKIVLEKYFGTFTQDSFWYWASAGKTVTAFLVGQAQEAGLLKIGDRTSQYLGAGWTSCPPDKEALITVRHQLTMTSGLDDGLPPTAAVPDPDNCEAPSCLQYKADAGTRWAYHNAAYTLLQPVVEAASKMTINQFTKTYLFDRTGMKGLWLDNVLYGKARDMARFGLLIQGGGVWNGDSLLRDRQYFYAMTHRSQALNKSYGYLWWLNGQESFMLPGVQLVFGGQLIPNAPSDLIAALGKNDQKIHVVPSKGWVVVRQGNAAAATGPNGGLVPTVFDNQLWLRLNQLVCTPTASSEPTPTGTARVYPNPSSNGWTVDLSNASFGQARLLDVNGHLRWQTALDKTASLSVPAAGLPEGVYYLGLLGDGQWQVLKLVKSN